MILKHQDDLKGKRIAIVYDWIDKWGGVERVLLMLYEMFPHAHFFTSYYDPLSAPWAKKLTIKTSFIQHLPDFIKKNRLFSLFLYPYAFESFDFSSYDIVISVTSSFAKSVITKPRTLHICYILTPTRYLWLYPEIYADSWIKKMVYPPFFSCLRKWDFIVSQRPDHYFSISKTVQKRVEKYYKKASEIIHPPFSETYWMKIKNEKFPAELDPALREKVKNCIEKFINKRYFLVVSRLELYKKVDFVIHTFNKSQEHLIIVGTGIQLNRLKKIAGENITFFQNITDQELAYFYQHAQALIMPQEEDFGYVSLEAQFFGCPVIAYHKGGATETVMEGKTGIFFDEQNKTALTKALANFHTLSYTLKQQTIQCAHNNMEQYKQSVFQTQFIKYISSKL